MEIFQQFDALFRSSRKNGLFILRLSGGPMSEPQHGSLVKKKLLNMRIWATALPTISEPHPKRLGDHETRWHCCRLVGRVGAGSTIGAGGKLVQGPSQTSCDPLSKLLVSPLITPIVGPYNPLYNPPMKEFRLQLM